MKTVNVKNIESRIACINSTLKNKSFTNYVLPIQLKQLRFEEDCLRKLLELINNKPVSSKSVDLPRSFYGTIQSGKPVSDGCKVPEGWKLVPVDPTDKMINAALGIGGFTIRSTYTSMISAAPAAPGGQDD